MKPYYSHRLLNAITYAVNAHKNDKRKVDGLPYITHPISVFGLLSKWNTGENVQIVGLLHDTIEDAENDEERAKIRVEIEEKFGKKVLQHVEGVTEQDKSLSWKERKEAYLKHIKTASEESCIVSCADLTHNLSTFVESYKNDGEKIWEHFNAVKQWKIWFIDQRTQILKERLSTKFTEELNYHLQELNDLISKPLPPEYSSSFTEIDNGNGTVKFMMDPTYQAFWDHCMLTKEEMEKG